MAQATLCAAVSEDSHNISINGRTNVCLEVRCGQLGVTTMVSVLLSIGFGIVGFIVFFFGIGSPWQISLGVGVVTAIKLWLADRLTRTREAPMERQADARTQSVASMAIGAHRRAFAWLNSHFLLRSHAQPRLLRVNSQYTTSVRRDR